MNESVMSPPGGGKPDLSNLPQELRDRPQWVLHKAKVPHHPDGSLASVTNPETWRSFDEVVTAYEAGGFDGIGFVFTKDDPFCGVDLDHCRTPETGEIKPWAREIIDEIASSSEISPSGPASTSLPAPACPRRGGAATSRSIPSAASSP